MGVRWVSWARGFLAWLGLLVALLLAPRALAAPSPEEGNPSPTSSAAADATLPAQLTGRVFCRQGPGPYYPALDVLYPGTRITLIGQHPVYYFYWLARTEDGLECWVPRRWTDAPPDAAERLPRVPEVPPPPPGAFVVVRYRPVFMVPFCPEFFGPALQFTVKNLGPEPIRSMEMWIQVLETGAVYHTVSAEGVPTCLKTRTQIPSHARADIVARTKVDLTEKPILITIKACTKTYFRGSCVQYTMRWTVPKPPVYPMVRP